MVYKKQVQKLFNLKPVNNTFWFFYTGFVLNSYDIRRLYKCCCKKDLWINLLKFDINYLIVSHPLDFYYIVNVDKTVGEVTLNNF